VDHGHGSSEQDPRRQLSSSPLILCGGICSFRDHPLPPTCPLQPHRFGRCPWPARPTHLQCMMDEWCSPYSSWPSTMKGCSGWPPPPSGPAMDIRATGSTGSTWSSRKGSASEPLASGFFSAHCGQQSRDMSARKGLHTQEHIGGLSVVTESRGPL
jgi:hypothetical protein